jgi:hypothetical protein
MTLPISLRPHGDYKLSLYKNSVSLYWAEAKKSIRIYYPKDVTFRDGRYIFDNLPTELKQLAFMCAWHIRKHKGERKDLDKNKHQVFQELKGKIGELVAGHIIFGHYATAFRNFAIGRSDDIDFDFRDKKIDVKTSERETMNINKFQIDKQKNNEKQARKDSSSANKQVDYYVAVKVDTVSKDIKERIKNNWSEPRLILDMLKEEKELFNRAYIMGYLSSKKLKELIENGQATDCKTYYQISARDLDPITDLEEKLSELIR